MGERWECVGERVWELERVGEEEPRGPETGALEGLAFAPKREMWTYCDRSTGPLVDRRGIWAVPIISL